MQGPSFIDRVIMASLYSKIETQPLDRTESSFKAPTVWEQRIASILDPIFSAFSSAYCEKKAILSNRLMMMEEAKKKFAHVGAATSEVLQPEKVRSAAPEKEDQLSPEWINAHPETSLFELGLNNLDKVKEFLIKHGNELKSLNLKDMHTLDDEQFGQFMQYSPNLNHLFIASSKISDQALEHLKGMPLTSVDFSWCEKLTDQAIEHLKGMLLTSVKFSGCYNLTDKALEHLKGMPLTSVSFTACDNLTDKALEHLKGMPLTSVAFSDCDNLTDKALEHLKGMPLTSVNFSFCNMLTDKAIEHLKGMPLTSVSFNGCKKLTDKALEHLKGMPLTSVDFSLCYNLTDKALEHLKGMPLTSVSFSDCDNITTDQALDNLKREFALKGVVLKVYL